MTFVILGLGSNLKNRKTNLLKSIDLICETSDINYIAKSDIYDNKALLPPGAPKDWDKDYLNIALKIQTKITALDLLDRAKKIELILGRKEHEKWSPRIIDIDILAYGNQVINSDLLTIPHKDLLFRDFALKPFAQIWPDWQYPIAGPDYGKKIQEFINMS
jgi:2-amino-4-hydroxy-6-hydroxymethyldihydropteridine diphosphokinase